jgi:cold shock CspA family protein
MIGSIKNLNFGHRSGFITAEGGRSIYFAASAVWEYDYSFLTVGQLVSFDLLDGQWPKAVNVHRFEGRHPTNAREVPQGSTEVRFVGFDQENGVRTFRFQAVICHKEEREFTVTADMSMFGKHHVVIQEGPALCSRMVAAELAAGRTGLSQLVLTEKDILAHVASRPIPKPRRFRRVRPGLRVLG